MKNTSIFMPQCTLYESCLEYIANKLALKLVGQREVCAAEVMKLLDTQRIPLKLFTDIVKKILLNLKPSCDWYEMSLFSDSFYDHIQRDELCGMPASWKTRFVEYQQTLDVIGFCFVILMVASEEQVFTPFFVLNIVQRFELLRRIKYLITEAAIETFFNLHNSHLCTKKFERFFPSATEVLRCTKKKKLFCISKIATILDLSSEPHCCEYTTHVLHRIREMLTNIRIVKSCPGPSSARQGQITPEVIIKLNTSATQEEIEYLIPVKESAEQQGLSVQISKLSWNKSTYMSPQQLQCFCHDSLLRELHFLDNDPTLLFDMACLSCLSSLNVLELGFTQPSLHHEKVVLNEQKTESLWNYGLSSLPALKELKFTGLQMHFPDRNSDVSYNTNLKRLKLENCCLTQSLLDWLLENFESAPTTALKILTICSENFDDVNLQNHFLLFLEKCSEFVEEINIQDVDFCNAQQNEIIIHRFKQNCSENAHMLVGGPVCGYNDFFEILRFELLKIPYLNSDVIHQCSKKKLPLFIDISKQDTADVSFFFLPQGVLPRSCIQWNISITKHDHKCPNRVSFVYYYDRTIN